MFSFFREIVGRICAVLSCTHIFDSEIKAYAKIKRIISNKPFGVVYLQLKVHYDWKRDIHFSTPTSFNLYVLHVQYAIRIFVHWVSNSVKWNWPIQITCEPEAYRGLAWRQHIMATVHTIGNKTRSICGKPAEEVIELCRREPCKKEMQTFGCWCREKLLVPRDSTVQRLHLEWRIVLCCPRGNSRKLAKFRNYENRCLLRAWGESEHRFRKENVAKRWMLII